MKTQLSIHKNLLTSLLPAFMLLLAFLPCNVHAQAVPDTNLNTVFKDTTRLIESRNAKNTEDSIRLASELSASKDTVAKKSKVFSTNPKKAGMYSAILPGLGQLYNRQYWKIPIIYAGIGVSAYYFADNLSNYNTYRKAYIDFPNDQFGGKYNQSQLQQIRDDYERFLDFTVLLAGAGYMIQILDAVASAHLRDFDISRDLSLKMRPVATPSGIGFGLVLNMKNKPKSISSFSPVF